MARGTSEDHVIGHVVGFQTCSSLDQAARMVEVTVLRQSLPAIGYPVHACCRTVKGSLVLWSKCKVSSGLKDSTAQNWRGLPRHIANESASYQTVRLSLIVIEDDGEIYRHQSQVCREKIHLRVEQPKPTVEVLSPQSSGASSTVVSQVSSRLMW